MSQSHEKFTYSKCVNEGCDGRVKHWPDRYEEDNSGRIWKRVYKVCEKCGRFQNYRTAK